MKSDSFPKISRFLKSISNVENKYNDKDITSLSIYDEVNSLDFNRERSKINQDNLDDSLNEIFELELSLASSENENPSIQAANDQNSSYSDMNGNNFDVDNTSSKILLDFINKDTQNLIDSINSYYLTEGKLDNFYNVYKDINGNSLTRENLENYVQNEKIKTEILSTALKNGSIKVVDSLSGTDDDTSIDNGSICSSKMKEIICQKVKACKSFEDVISYAKSYLNMDEEIIFDSIKEYSQINPVNDFEINKKDDGKFYISVNGSEHSSFNDELVQTYLEYFDENYLDKLSSAIVNNYVNKEEYTFEEMYSFFTGVDYSAKNIQQLSELKPIYEQALFVYSFANSTEDFLNNCTSPLEFVTYFENKLGIEKKYAVELFNTYYSNAFSNLASKNVFCESGSYIGLAPKDVLMSEDGKSLTVNYVTKDDFNLDELSGTTFSYDAESGIVSQTIPLTYVDNLGSEQNCEFSQMDINLSPFFEINQLINSNDILVEEAISSFNLQNQGNFGTFEDVVKNYNTLYNQTFGSNVLNEKFNEYKFDMDTYTSNFSGKISNAGFLMSFVNPMFGILTLVGAYSDNAIDLINLSSNKIDGELAPWAVNTGFDVFMTAVGMKLGKWSSDVGVKTNDVLAKNGINNPIFGTFAEAGLDFASGYSFDIAAETTKYILENGDLSDEQMNNIINNSLMSNLLAAGMDIKAGISLSKLTQQNTSKSENILFNKLELDDVEKVDSIIPLEILPSNIFDADSLDLEIKDMAKNLDLESQKLFYEFLSEINPDSELIDLIKKNGIENSINFIKSIDGDDYSEFIFNLANLDSEFVQKLLLLCNTSQENVQRILSSHNKAKDLVSLGISQNVIVDYMDFELPLSDLLDLKEQEPVKFSNILNILNNKTFSELLKTEAFKYKDCSLIYLDNDKLDCFSKALNNNRVSELLRSSFLNFYSLTSDFTPLMLDLINRDECYHLIKSGLISFNILQKNVVSSMPNSDMKYAYPYAPEKFAKFEELLVCEREFNLISNLYNYVTMPVADNLFELSPEQIIKLTETIQSISSSGARKFDLKILELQNDAGYEIVARKTFVPKSFSQSEDQDISFDEGFYYKNSLYEEFPYHLNEGVTLEIVVSPNTEVNISRIEKKNQQTINFIKGKGSSLMFSSPNNRTLETQMELVRDENGELIGILHTKVSDVLAGTYRTVMYNFSDYPEDMDVPKAILDGTITGGVVLSEAVKNTDGSISYFENYEDNGVKINRTYDKKTNEQGLIASTSYSFDIVDENDKKLLALSRSFVQNEDGSTTTKIGDKTYTAHFDDKSKLITIVDESGKTRTIDIFTRRNFDASMFSITFKKSNVDASEQGMQQLFEFFKQVPADTLISLNNNNYKVFLCDDLKSCFIPRGRKYPAILLTGKNLPIMAHEVGHSISYMDLCLFEKNNELIDIYNKEMQQFRMSKSSTQEAVISYFSQQGGGPSNTGLSEFIAETISLLTTYGYDNERIVSRAMYIARYFPKTISKIAEIYFKTL